MSLLKSLAGGMLALAALGLFGGCASTNDAGPAGSTPPATSASVIAGEAPPSAATPSLSLSSSPTPAAGSTQISMPSPPTSAGGARQSLVGTVEKGVEANCLILTDQSTGKLYNLIDGDKTIVKVGAKVRVVGVIRTDLMTVCQQGTNFQVLTATKA